MAKKPERTFLLKSERMGCYKNGVKIAEPVIGGKPTKFTKAELAAQTKEAVVEEEVEEVPEEEVEEVPEEEIIEEEVE